LILVVDLGDGEQDGESVRREVGQPQSVLQQGERGGGSARPKLDAGLSEPTGDGDAQLVEQSRRLVVAFGGFEGEGFDELGSLQSGSLTTDPKGDVERFLVSSAAKGSLGVVELSAQGIRQGDLVDEVAELLVEAGDDAHGGCGGDR
jgi:hypothetical protein